MGIQVTGLKQNIQTFSSFEKKLSEGVNAVLNRYGQMMRDSAKSDHRYQDRTGELTRSIKFSVSGSEWVLNFFLDGNMTLVSGGRKYSTFQHDGTYDDYLPSEYSEKYSSTSGRSGIKHDHFMVRAFERYKDQLIRDLGKVLLGAL